MERKNQWYAGIDWATEEHVACVLNHEGKVIGERTVVHSGHGLAELTSWLSAFADGDTSAVHVAIEVPHGPVVETLLEKSFAVYAINPKQLDRFRDRFTMAGAKDDRRDAKVLADSLRTDMRCYQKLRTEDPTLIELREHSRMLDELTQEKVRQSNRMREQLRRYYPQMLLLETDMNTEWFLKLWEMLPTPEKARRVRTATVQRLLTSHKVRRFCASEVLEKLQQKPLTVAPGTTEAVTMHIAAIVERLRLVNQQTKRTLARLDELCAALIEGDAGSEPEQKRELHDAEILRSLPGVGRIVLAVLLAEAWRAIESRDYHSLRALSGMAPVTRRSGKSRVVVMRRACHQRLRDALYHWARVAAQHDPKSKAKYKELRSRGHRHGRALRSIADRLLAVMCAMLRNRTLYNPDAAKLEVAQAS